MDNRWGFHYKNIDIEENIAETFRCNKVKYRRDQCDTGLYLYHACTNSEVILYRSQLTHICNGIATRGKNKIPSAVKAKINSLNECDNQNTSENIQKNYKICAT